MAKDNSGTSSAERMPGIQARVLECMSEGVSVANEQGIIVFTNPAEDAMFGYEPGELLGKHLTIQNAYEPEENDRRMSAIMAELTEKGVCRGEWRNVRKD